MSEAIIMTLLSGSGISAIVSLLNYFNNRKGSYKESIAVIQTQLQEIRKDTLRLQLLNLMQHDPHNKDTILTVAEEYFSKMNGNWYMGSSFSKWAKENNVEIPTWYKEK